MSITVGYNADVARKYGIVEAMLLEQIEFYARSSRRKDGYCWFTAKEFELRTAVKTDSMRRAINKLLDAKMIETKNTYIVGTQIKCRHFKIISPVETEYMEIQEFEMLDLQQSDYSETPQSDSGKMRESDSSKMPQSVNSLDRAKTELKHIQSEKVINKEAKEIANEFASKILENYSFKKITEKHINTWSDDIEKLNRLDGYEYDLIRATMIWSQQDDFWKQNIQSGSKLRDKFETLLVRIKTEQESQPIFINLSEDSNGPNY